MQAKNSESNTELELVMLMLTNTVSESKGLELRAGSQGLINTLKRRC